MRSKHYGITGLFVVLVMIGIVLLLPSDSIANDLDNPLLYSRLLDSPLRDEGVSIVTDGMGYIYILGKTDSQDFPMMNSLDSSFNGETDCFLTKLDSSNNEIVFSTFIGGSGLDLPTEMILGPTGDIFIAGRTTSTDFPSTQSSENVSSINFNSFVMRLDQEAQTIKYSLLFGGSNDDICHSIAIGSDGHIISIGGTSSNDFPILNGFNTTFGGEEDGFIIELNRTGSIVFSSYFSGSRSEDVHSLVLDESGELYLVGSTNSDDFLGKNLANDGHDCFIVEYNRSAKDIEDFLMVGGDGFDIPVEVQLSYNGMIYVVGRTSSMNFPLINPLISSAPGGGRDLFLLQISETDFSMEYSTYIGSEDYDDVSGMCIDESGSVIIAGHTQSSNFPIEDAFIETHQGGLWDGFVVKMDTVGNSLEFSTYIGGSNVDMISDITLDDNGTVLITGHTDSSNFPFKPSTAEPRAIGCFVVNLQDMTDSDNDNLSDQYEDVLGTNSRLVDSDGDSFPDEWELRNGYDPNSQQTDIREYMMYYSLFIGWCLSVIGLFSIVFLNKSFLSSVLYPLWTMNYHWRSRIMGTLTAISFFIIPIGLRFRVLEGNLSVWLDFILPIILESGNEGWMVLMPYSLLGVFLPIFMGLVFLLIWQIKESVSNQTRQSLFLRCLGLFAILDIFVFFPSMGFGRGIIPLPISFIIGIVFYYWSIPVESDDVFENHETQYSIN